MMVQNTFLSGQVDLHRYSPVAKAVLEKTPEKSTEKGILERSTPEKVQEKNVVVQIAFNGDTAASKPFGLATAFAVAGSAPPAQK